MSAVVIATNTFAAPLRPGDVNGNGRVDGTDLTLLREERFDGGDSDADSCAGGRIASNAGTDVNGDGIITSADITARCCCSGRDGVEFPACGPTGFGTS